MSKNHYRKGLVGEGPFFKALKDLLPIVAALIVLASLSDAYVISHNRIIKVGNGSNETLNPIVAAQNKTFIMREIESLQIGREQIQKIRDCHAQDGTIGYQGGYDTACDMIRSLLGLKISPFKSGPQTGHLANMPTGDNVLSYSFKLQTGGYIALNASEYRLEYWHGPFNNWPKQADYWNMSQRLYDEWRIFPNHRSSIRNPAPDWGMTYENLENVS